MNGPSHYAAAEKQLTQLQVARDLEHIVRRAGLAIGHGLLALTAVVFDTSLDPAWEDEWSEVKR